MTPAMLEIGKTEAEKQNFHNMAFVIGDAQELPFLANSFDIVISRLAFHHFPDVNRAFEEMVRVLKPNGKLILIDMEAAESKLRTIRDTLETLRDPSHVRNLSKNEMLNLFASHAFYIDKCETTSLPTSLDQWLDFTKTPALNRQKLIDYFKREQKGMDKTGFYPYETDHGIFFDQKWILIVGRKP